MMSTLLFFFSEDRTTNARIFPRIPKIPNVETRYPPTMILNRSVGLLHPSPLQ